MTAGSDIVEGARAVLGPRLLGLFAFGSRVDGTAHLGSDLDVAVWVEGPIRRQATWVPWARHFAEREPELDPTFFTSASLDAPPGWMLEALRRGVQVLYDPSGELAARLASVREGVAAGVYRRKLFMGLPYYERTAAS